MITGDEQYLESYHAAIQTVDQDLALLRALTADNASYQQKFDILEPLIATKLAEITQTNNLRKSQRLESAAKLVSTYQGRPILDNILQLIEEMRDEQEQVLRQRSDEAEVRAQTMHLSLTFGSFLAVIIAAFIINRGIIERKRAGAALRESAVRFHRLAENALDMIYRHRLLATPGFEYVSPAATAITGYTPEEFYADPDLYYKLVHPEDHGLIESLKHPSDSTVPLTVRWIHKDGSVIWTSQQLVPISDSEGNLVEIEGIVRDVSERMLAYQMLERRVEERTHEIERRRQVAESLYDLMTILNSNRP